MDYPTTPRDEKDYPVKIRIEIGPGVPSQLSPIQEWDAHVAMLAALQEFLTHGRWPAGRVATGSHGSKTVHAYHQKAHIGTSELSIPWTLIEEHEFIVRIAEGPGSEPDGDAPSDTGPLPLDSDPGAPPP